MSRVRLSGSIGVMSFVTLAIVSSGCDARGSTEWSMAFASAELRDRALVIRAQIREGRCDDSGREVYQENLMRVTAAPSPPVLPQGRYAFAASVLDDDCVVFAEGCADERLDAGDHHVTTNLASTAEIALCPAECRAQSDVPPDAAVDAGDDNEGSRTCSGDLNGDGDVAVTDVSIVSYCTDDPDGVCCDRADLNDDGEIDECDLRSINCLLLRRAPYDCCFAEPCLPP